ncbi:ABC transporter permease [Anaerococcus sp. mt242]|uniref:ABC transporter permease n=1 Tax=Anaerococcus sp. mt242 TaxID=2661917 RepID=UPI00193269B7|nr:FtsX-like permease family protein [Anaerococcus sp. mt242]MBM0045491.1 ABC transporter permease [Anaerococcus sp. mt242]
MKSLYHRLAIDGIRRHKRLYLPFIGTTVFFIVLINLCLSIMQDPLIKQFFGATTIGSLMKLGSIILSIFALITILTNYNFIQKNKSEESGLYLMLGMEKRHLTKIYFHELLNLYLKSVIIGTIISAVIYKLVLAGLFKLMESDVNVLENGILADFAPLLLTALIMLGIFIVLLVKQSIKSKNFTPLSFMQEGRAGQKAPRFPILLGIFGIICIGAGYYISLTTQNPIQAFKLFFLAVILVIIGTYAAFSVIVSGILKLLQKNKNFYYKKSNFTAVSGLIYRVKNSANTLASIAILSTMVIVVLTSGFSLYFATSEIQESVYRTDYKLSFPADKEIDYYKNKVEEILTENNKKGKIWTYKSTLLPVDRAGSTIRKKITDDQSLDGSEIDMVYFVLDEDSTYDFAGNDAVFIQTNENRQIEKIDGLDIKVKKELKENYPSPISITDISLNDTDQLIFKDPKVFDQAIKAFATEWFGDGPVNNVNFDVDGDYDPYLRDKMWDELKNNFDDDWFSFYDSQAEKHDLLAIYAGIFVVGIILGLGFLVSTVLAIYYKQLSEGMEDKSRFKTMRQLGMTDREAKKSISKQMGLVFFLPLAFAFMHSLFAIPIITKFLQMLSLNNVKLYILCLVSVFVAYIIFYLITFKMTEKTYNDIVLE